MADVKFWQPEPDHGAHENRNGHVLEVFKTFLKLGLTSFGGPVAHIGYFHKELVTRQGWVSPSQFSQLLAICQFLPGPASSQLGFSLGYQRAGLMGALAAFLAFTLPSVLLLIGFASVLHLLSSSMGVAVIQGLKLVACAVVADAVLGMWRKLCTDGLRRLLAIIAAVVVVLVGSVWVQLAVVIMGAMAGVLWGRDTPSGYRSEDGAPISVGYGPRVGIVIAAMFVCAWGLLSLAPVNDALYQIADTFYRAGALVFGGGHVVLPLLEESVVTSGWVSEETFLAGYGASQAIPGPMFAFSAYLGALIPTEYSSGAGAAVALLCMFLPGFLLLMAVLPLWQQVSHNVHAVNGIAGVSAVVVGLLAAALYDPILTSGVVSVLDLLIVLVGFAMLTLWRLSPLWVVLWCVSANVLLTLLNLS